MRVVDIVSGVALPEVEHDGKHYVVAQPGCEFRIEGNQFSGRSAQAQLWVDGDKIQMHFNMTTSDTFTYNGYPTNGALTEFDSFKFAAAEIAEPGRGGGSGSAGPVINPDAGTIKMTVYGATKTEEQANTSWTPQRKDSIQQPLMNKGRWRRLLRLAISDTLSSAPRWQARSSSWRRHSLLRLGRR